MSEKDQVAGRQIAAGRVLAGMAQDDLAMASKISVPTLRRMEASPGAATGLANNVGAVRAALEAAGVEFIPENGGGAGVRLRKRRDGTEGDHPKPAGLATDVVERMEAEIAADKRNRGE